jgi:hypothetical protein
MLLASKLIECGCILHNLAIQHGFSGEELGEEDDQPGEGQFNGQDQPDPGLFQQDPLRERRRNQLLAFFQ